MMQSKERITRENAMDIIRRFAKEYRKTITLKDRRTCILRNGTEMDEYMRQLRQMDNKQ